MNTTDLDKLGAVVAYLAKQSRHDDDFGRTKLVKLLYYSDCAAYLRHGKPITGCTYIRMPHGPYPQDWSETERILASRGIVNVEQEGTPGGYVRQRLLPTQQPDPAALTDADRAILDAQVRRFAGRNASEIVEYSHGELGWRISKPSEEIPYHFAGFRAPPPPTAETRAMAQSIADSIREKGYRPTNDITP